jgi:hypothetical protein
MSWRHWILLAAILAIITGALLFPRIPQDPAYHNFADHRGLLGVPNFFDVTSNLFFLFVGLAGMRFVNATPSVSARRSLIPSIDGATSSFLLP